MVHYWADHQGGMIINTQLSYMNYLVLAACVQLRAVAPAMVEDMLTIYLYFMMIKIAT